MVLITFARMAFHLSWDSEHIKIRKKEDKPGIDILIDGDTKGEKVFIPVVVSVSGMTGSGL